jgi:thiol:disulfide interchange protein
VRKEIEAYLERFTRIRLWTDRQTAEDKKNQKLLLNTFKFNGLPLYVFMTPDGKEVARLPKSVKDALPTAAQFIEAFQKAEKQALNGN